MKRIMAFLILLFWICSLMLPCLYINKPLVQTDQEQIQNSNGIIKENEEKKIVFFSLFNLILSWYTTDMENVEENVDYEQEMQREINNIDKTLCRQDWFIAYKNIIKDYSNIVETPKTIYDAFTDEELDLLFRVVQAEIGNYDFDEICNVVSVIYNRVNHQFFGDELSTVLTYDQFATISNGSYLTVEILEKTILACEYVYIFGDTTNGALFFESGGFTHSAYADYMFTDKAGHHFYK